MKRSGIDPLAGNTPPVSVIFSERLTISAALAVLAFLIGGCGGSAAAGAHSYVYEDEDSVRYIEWDTGGDDSLSGSWRGVYYDPEEEDGTGSYEDALAGRVDEASVSLDPASQDLVHAGTVEGDEFALEWGGEDPGGRTYEEGSREDYEAAKAEFEEGAEARVAADEALAGAEEVVYDDLSTFSTSSEYYGIDGEKELLRETQEEIAAVLAANERENAANRRMVGVWDEEWDEPEICISESDDPEAMGEPTNLDSEVLYDPDEAYDEHDVDDYEEQLEEKRAAIADAEEELAGLEETPEGAQQRLAEMEARVEEDAGKVEELEGLVKETSEAYRLAAPKNEEAFEEYDRLYDEADCIPD